MLKRRKKLIPKKVQFVNPDEVTQFLIQEIPLELKTLFKERCARNNVAMKNVIIEFMEGYVA